MTTRRVFYLVFFLSLPISFPIFRWLENQDLTDSLGLWYTLYSTCVTGLILAGGQASRMGGKDKGLLFLNNKPLIEHAIDKIKPQVQQIHISCNRNLSSYQHYGFPISVDSGNTSCGKTQYKGPLAGILACLSAIDSKYTLIIPCDCPAFPDDLAKRLLKALVHTNSDAAVPFDGERIQPLFLLMKTELRDSLSCYYNEEGRSMKGWLKRIVLTEVDFSQERESFINLNTTNELQDFSQKNLK